MSAPDRTAMLAVTAVAALLSVLAFGAQADGAGGGGREDCGTFSSASIYEKAKVIAIRGVGCREARKVAKKYDHEGQSRGPWECFLAHGGKRRLFSCGYGGSQGDVRDFPHALVAKGVGSPSG